MKTFHGFPEGKARLTSIPAQFFSDLLPEIDHLGELKITLYTFWRLSQMEGAFRCVRRDEYLSDSILMQGLGPNPQEARQTLQEALDRAVWRGTLLKAELLLEGGGEELYFLNSPKGRAAVQAIQRGEWRPSGQPQMPIELGLQRPNIYRLYEEHIGPLTPMIAESLQEAEDTYPADWIEDAIRMAVENNKRSWRYTEAILRRWKEKGRDDQKNRRDTEKDRRRYKEWES